MSIKNPYFEFHTNGKTFTKKGTGKNRKKLFTYKGGSMCKKCGATECDGKFWKLFVPVSWFRGDDYLDGIYCEQCKRKYESEFNIKI